MGRFPLGNCARQVNNMLTTYLTSFVEYVQLAYLICLGLNYICLGLNYIALTMNPLLLALIAYIWPLFTLCLAGGGVTRDILYLVGIALFYDYYITKPEWPTVPNIKIISFKL